MASSEDGFHFLNYPKPVFTVGEPQAWDSGAVADPYVIKKGAHLYLFYLGQDHLGVQRLGVARSQDGISWDKLVSNPILDVGDAGDFDENGLGEPSVAYEPPYFFMMYTGRRQDETRNLGYAVSKDGAYWRKLTAKGLLTDAQRAEWNSKVMCDSTLLSAGGGKWNVWFGGGNKAEPAEHLNGAVGMMVVDFAQGRDLSMFEANIDWGKTLAKSTEVLKGSFPIDSVGVDGGQKIAWVGPVSSLTLTSEQGQQGKPFVLRGWIPAASMLRASGAREPVKLRFLINGKEVVAQQFFRDEGFVLSVPWERLTTLLADDGLWEIELHVSQSFVPAKAIKNGDWRRVAMAIRSAKFE